MRKISFIICIAAALAACSKGPEEYKLGTARLGISLDAEADTLHLLYPAPRVLNFNVRALSKADADLVLDLSVDPSLVEGYNQAHGSDFIVPSQDLCTFSRGQVILPRFNEESSRGSLTINSEYLPEEGVCLIPLVISKVKGKKDVECETLFLPVGRFDIPNASMLDKRGWSMVFYETEDPMSYSSHNFVREDNPSSTITGYAKDLIDGSHASIWAYKSGSTIPFHFVIDLGKQYTIRQIDLWAQRGDKHMEDATNTVPSRQCATAVFEFANTLSGDGMGDLGGNGSADWFGRETFGPDVLKNEISNSVYLSELRYARYIRFTYVNCYYTAADVAPRTTYFGGALAELDFWGYDQKIELK